MTSSSLAPSSADVLLFDLGRVVLDIDFDKVMTHLGRPCRLRARRCLGAVCGRRSFQASRDRPRSTIPRSSRTCAARSASPFPTTSSWKAGTRSSPAKCRGSRHCSTRAAKSLPLYAFSNTNPPHVAHFSKTYPDVLGHFREIFLSSTIGLRKPDAAAYDHVVQAIGVPAQRIVFFDDSADNIAGARARGLVGVHVTSTDDVAKALAELGI